MFTIFFYNMGFTYQDSFSSLDEAIAKAVKCGFDANIIQNGHRVVGTWSIVGGFRNMVR
jgi:hypothetical protein